MNVVDSSGWLEYFGDGPNAKFFAATIESPNELLVPSLSLFEVFKRMMQQRGEAFALEAVATMREAIVVDLTSSLAIAAAKLSITEKIPMADSIILATARAHGATLWTQNADFEGLAGVKYLPKPRQS